MKKDYLLIGRIELMISENSLLLWHDTSDLTGQVDGWRSRWRRNSRRWWWLFSSHWSRCHQRIDVVLLIRGQSIDVMLIQDMRISLVMRRWCMMMMWQEFSTNIRVDKDRWRGHFVGVVVIVGWDSCWRRSTLSCALGFPLASLDAILLHG